MNSTSQFSRLTISIFLTGWLSGVLAADQPAFETGTRTATAHNSASAHILASVQKPAWLTELSVGTKESYDDNVFLAGVDQKYLPPVYTVPPGSVAALQNRWSWVTTISPKVGINFAPLLRNQNLIQTLSLAYAPDFVIYHDQPSESYDAHRFGTVVKGKTGGLSFSLDEAMAYIDGSEYGPTYPGGFVTAYNVGAPRERREQIQDRATVAIQYDWDKWFFRPTASLLDYDMMTKLINVTGYQNYESRYDVNGGPDLGCKIIPQLAVTVGYRYGHQYQQQFSFSPYSSSSDYQRVLLGIEGKPWNWLEVKIQGGPDFRDYVPDTATHVTPINDKHLITYYGEASLTATVTPKDTVTFKYKQWQWVSSVGKVPYFDSTFDLGYHRKLTDKIGCDLGWRLLMADYTSGDLSTCRRNDWQYTISAGLGYAFNSHASINLAYVLDLGRNAQDGITNPDTRDYNHELISLGALFKF